MMPGELEIAGYSSNLNEVPESDIQVQTGLSQATSGKATPWGLGYQAQGYPGIKNIDWVHWDKPG